MLRHRFKSVISAAGRSKYYGRTSCSTAPVRFLSSEGKDSGKVSQPSLLDNMKLFDPDKGIFFSFTNSFLLNRLTFEGVDDTLPPVEYSSLGGWSLATFVKDSGDALLSFLEMTHPFQPEVSVETKNHLKEMVESEDLLNDWFEKTAELAEHFDEGELQEWMESKYELVKIVGVTEFLISTHKNMENGPDPASSWAEKHVNAAVTVKYLLRLVHPKEPLNFYETVVNCTFGGCLRGCEPLVWKILDIQEYSTDIEEGEK